MHINGTDLEISDSICDQLIFDKSCKGISMGKGKYFQWTVSEKVNLNPYLIIKATSVQLLEEN